MASWQEETMMPLFTTEEEREGNPTPSTHLKQMAISKQASSIFVDTTPFLNYSYLGYLQL